MSNRGGKRENAGRPSGQGKYSESTVSVRAPLSKVTEIKDYLQDSLKNNTPLNVSEFLIDHKASTFFVTIQGQSMIDVGLLSGDKAVVDCSKTAVVGDIVLAVVDQEFTIKIYDYGLNKMPRLMPANSSGDYRPIYIRPGMQFEIFEVVTGSFRRFK